MVKADEKKSVVIVSVYISYTTEDKWDVYKDVQKQQSKMSSVRIITAVWD